MATSSAYAPGHTACRNATRHRQTIASSGVRKSLISSTPSTASTDNMSMCAMTDSEQLCSRHRFGKAGCLAVTRQACARCGVMDRMQKRSPLVDEIKREMTPSGDRSITCCPPCGMAELFTGRAEMAGNTESGVDALSGSGEAGLVLITYTSKRFCSA